MEVMRTPFNNLNAHIWNPIQEMLLLAPIIRAVLARPNHERGCQNLTQLLSAIPMLPRLKASERRLLGGFCTF